MLILRPLELKKINRVQYHLPIAANQFTLGNTLTKSNLVLPCQYEINCLYQIELSQIEFVTF